MKKIDILLCVDGTSSMGKVIEEVKANITSFVNNLIERLKIDSNFEIGRIRIKLVVFRNADYDGDYWFQETPFYNLEKSAERVNEFLKNIEATGGSPEINVEDGLMALSNALSTANWDSSQNDIQIIGIWTDTKSKTIDPNHKELKEGAPKTYEELKGFWINIFLRKHPNARLLLFAPDLFPWKNILEEWPNSIHYKSNKAGLEYKYPEIFLIKNLLVDLTPSFKEEDSFVESEEDKAPKELLEDSVGVKTETPSFWKKYRKILTISFAVLSFSLVSFRIVGLSLFSINVKYTRSVNDTNTKEFKEKLDEITTILKREGILSESTEIGYSSRIETRHGLFFDNSDLILQYSIKLSVQDYVLGQYSIREIRETMASAEIIAEHLNLVEDTYSHSGPILVNVIGETDATPIRGGIPYNGEIGRILETSFKYNNETFAIRIKEGDMIKDNVELGILRACSFWQHIKSLTNIFIPKETYLSYEVITHEEFGGAFRKSTLIVRLYDLKNFE